ncbi:hypothetical protein [Thiolapillus sp.]|uniref:hypothetical protein n=1 Tax=Thiolapillus sp. TaxID=2017437 RepID=UPI003AF9F60E
MKFYIEEVRYCGPNSQDEKYIDFDRFEITIAPPRTNASNEIRVNGWLGTSNDVARYAHGVYESLADAEGAVEHMLGHEYRRARGDSLPPGSIASVYHPGRVPPVTDEFLGLWLDTVEVPADADDEHLARLAEELYIDLVEDGGGASAARILECLLVMRDNAREALED